MSGARQKVLTLIKQRNPRKPLEENLLLNREQVAEIDQLVELAARREGKSPAVMRREVEERVVRFGVAAVREELGQ